MLHFYRCSYCETQWSDNYLGDFDGHRCICCGKSRLTIFRIEDGALYTHDYLCACGRAWSTESARWRHTTLCTCGTPNPPIRSDVLIEGDVLPFRVLMRE
jgi:hypothetical protein